MTGVAPEGGELVITPAPAPLSAARPRAPLRRYALTSTRARRAVALALPIALAVLAMFVVLRPPAVQQPAPRPLADQPAKPAGGGPVATAGTARAPYEALTIAQARGRAEQSLTGFLALQVRLEDERNAAVWGAVELDEAKARALAGDALFKAEQYGAALAEYDAALAALQALLAAGEARFEGALAAGAAALRAMDAPAARAAFDEAAEVYPQDARVLAGRDRAAQVPQVKALLLDADRALLRADYDAALASLQRVRAIAPEAPGLGARLAETAAGRAGAERRVLLSAAFGALERGDHGAAAQAFQKTLAAYPNDPAALAGAQQAEQGRLSERLAGLRAAADQAMRDEDWAAAAGRYRQALEIDPSLRFALAGGAEAEQRLALVRGMGRLIADPPLLSAPEEFVAAGELLTRAEAAAESLPESRFSAQVAALEAVLAAAAKPVPLVLTSDGATEVVIQRVRAVGTFTRLELSLRPGRYVIVGSRDGCRDVRKEIVLSADMRPVDVRCEERI